MARLEGSERILLVGAGGGFDLLAGVPLFEHLIAHGKQPYYGSLSFSELAKARGQKLSSRLLEVRADAGGDDHYFPERYLSEWYALQSRDVPVYCFSPTGTQGVLEVYKDLVRHLQLDTIILVDGGTDSLMRGDEPGLGTPAEDMVSIAAADMLELPNKLMINLGFGVDAHHGVCHAYVLEAVADLTRTGDFLGAFSLLPGMPEFRALAESLDFICKRMPGMESIVCTSIVAAGEGCFGNHHPTTRTRGSELFLNPLMSMYWCFELAGVARRCLYLDYLKEKYSRWDIHRAINNYLYTVTPRPWLNIPL
jgi:hypothetical protein